ncbi:protein kinase rio1 [Thelotrema lepadinum]|nr:protein kinase rio1 [Thelotrema lepadinum]
MSISEDPAVGHMPTHTFIPNQGYLERELNDLQRNGTDNEPEEDQNFTDEEDDDLEDVFQDDSAAADYATNYPAAMAKAFNRQRKSQQVAADPNAPKSAMPKSNPQKPTNDTAASIDEQVKNLSRHAGKLRLNADFSEQGEKRQKGWEKSDRATTEQALDQRTRIILLQMINRNVVSEVNGCISTGKEANVYHAISTPEEAAGPTSLHRAIKIHKSRVVTFKDRERYVAGDHRFQKGYRKGNNRAMAKQWAEKEFRNLNRVHSAGIPCPKPVDLRLHVIVMELIGSSDGTAAPRLKDAVLENDSTSEASAKWHDLYLQILTYMRMMYAQCRLVHGDLSEYNILFHQGGLWIIDVSQAVEHDHPRSLEFLRMDIKNVNDFFSRKGVDTLLDRTVFSFITSTGSPAEKTAIEQAVRELLANPPQEDAGDDAEKEVENEVFRQQFIPQTLEQVYDIEKDGEQLAKTGKEDLVYGVLLADKVAALKPETPGGDLSSEGNGDPLHSDKQSSGSSESGSEDSDSMFRKGTPRGNRFEDKNVKRERKKRVKEEKREKREHKMPKYVKKRLVKLKARH